MEFTEYDKYVIDQEIDKLSPERYEQFMLEYKPPKSIYKFIVFGFLFNFLGISLIYLGLNKIKKSIIFLWIIWILLVVGAILYFFISAIGLVAIFSTQAINTFENTLQNSTLLPPIWVILIINLIFVYFIYIRPAKSYSKIIDNENYAEKIKILKNLEN